MDRVVIVVPAKEHSRRLHNKNIQYVGSDNLIDRAIQRSVESKLGDEIVVSTDSDTILAYIRLKYHRDVWVHPRPAVLCSDTTRAWEVCLGVVDVAKQVDKTFDTIIMTLPTSPFATSDDLKNAYKMFIDNDRKSVMSVTKCDFNLLTLCKMDDGEILEPWLSDYVTWSDGVIPDNKNPRFLSNGAVWVCDVDMLQVYKDQYIDGMLGYEMPKSRGLDINTMGDLLLARAMVEVGHEGVK